jgi:putative DNA primase/helicase
MTGVLERVLRRLKGVRPSGDGYLALCPAHDDHRPSLSIADGNSGVVINCHTGCEAEAIVAALGMHLGDLFDATGGASVKCEYEYRDENGRVSYVVERRPFKKFRQRRPDGAGGWVWNLKGIVPLPYRLPELIAADPIDRVFIVEGEKDVDTLWSRGFVATCNSGGAGKWRDTTLVIWRAGAWLSSRTTMVRDKITHARSQGRSLASPQRSGLWPYQGCL